MSRAVITLNHFRWKQPQDRYGRLRPDRWKPDPIPVHQGVDWQIMKKQIQRDDRRARGRWAQ